MRNVSIILEGKDGVGKSTTSGLTIHAVHEDGRRSVFIVDADTTNSTMASMFADVKLIDPTQAEAAGIVASFLRRSEDAMVVDTGARSEAPLISILERILPIAEKERVQVTVIRPITLSSFAQQNASAFVARMAPQGVKTIFARIEAQGRTKAHYASWIASQTRATALASLEGKVVATEIHISDVGVRWGDEVPSYGLSFEEVAKGDFSRIKPKLQERARATFDDGIQAHIGMWIEENALRLLAAMRELGLKL